MPGLGAAGPGGLGKEVKGGKAADLFFIVKLEHSPAVSPNKLTS